MGTWIFGFHKGGAIEPVCAGVGIEDIYIYLIYIYINIRIYYIYLLYMGNSCFHARQKYLRLSGDVYWFPVVPVVS